DGHRGAGHRRVFAGERRPDKVGPDESGTAGNEHPHGSRSLAEHRSRPARKACVTSRRPVLSAPSGDPSAIHPTAVPGEIRPLAVEGAFEITPVRMPLKNRSNSIR